MDFVNVREVVAAWVVAWIAAGMTGALVQPLREPSRRIGIHLASLGLVSLVSVVGLVTGATGVPLGPLHPTGLGWAISLYISALGLVVQTFSARHLAGDERYGSYLAWMTWILFFASAAWMADNVWFFAACWVAMDAGLIRLIAMQRRSRAARAVARMTWARLAPSMAGVLLLCSMAAWAGQTSSLGAGIRALAAHPGASLVAGLLLDIVALAQAGNWPFGRWLLDSAVTPTPVSALMHAGFVNAGGLLLAKFSPVLAARGILPRALLVAVAWISIAIGTGILMIHADYKRQLVASTMAQMGLMLTECAVGAYAVAMVHLLLHGLFKATLFLRSGSAVPRPDEVLVKAEEPSLGFPWSLLAGSALFLLYTLPHPADGLRLLSGLLLGAGCAVALTSAMTLRVGRWAGAAAVVLAGALALVLRDELIRAWEVLLGTPRPVDAQLAVAAAGLMALQAALYAWLRSRSRGPCSVRLYAWLAYLGDASPHAIEAQPVALETLGEEAILS